MSFQTVGDLAQSFQLRRQMQSARLEIDRLTNEMASGMVRDPGQKLGGNYSKITQVEHGLAMLAGRQAGMAEAQHFLAATQSALGQVETLVGDVARKLRLAESIGNAPAIANASAEAHAGFEQAMQALNTRFAGRSLFAGAASDGPALAPAADILAALELAVAGQTTAEGLTNAVRDWFTAPGGGFEAMAYLGSDIPLGPVQLSAGQRTPLGAQADDSDLREAMAGLALGALVHRGALAGQTEARAQTLGHSAAMLENGATGVISLAARIGFAEAQVERSISRGEAERHSLEIVRTGLRAADPYATALALEQARSRLETIFTITARLSRLSLSEYMR